MYSRISARQNQPEIVPSQQTKKAKRTPGGADCMDKEQLKEFLQMLVSNDWELGDALGRVLILKHYVSPDASPAQLNMNIVCLKLNVTVEVLYLQSFEKVSVPYSLSQIHHLHLTLYTYATLTRGISPCCTGKM
jgi:hypothetical protein